MMDLVKRVEKIFVRQSKSVLYSTHANAKATIAIVLEDAAMVAESERSSLLPNGQFLSERIANAIRALGKSDG